MRYGTKTVLSGTGFYCAFLVILGGFTAQLNAQVCRVYNSSTNAFTYEPTIDGSAVSSAGLPAGAYQGTTYTAAIGKRLGVVIVCGTNRIPTVPAYYDNAQSGVTYNFTGWACGDSGCRTNTKTLKLTNGTTSPQWAVWTISGAMVHEKILQAGETAQHSETVYLCPDGSHTDYQAGFLQDDLFVSAGQDGDVTVVSNPGTNIVVNYDPNIDPTVNTTNNAAYGPTNYVVAQDWRSQTNTYINFAGTATTAARDETLKAGFNALVSGVADVKKAVDLNTAATVNQGTAPGGAGTNEISITVSNTVGLTSNELWSAQGQVNDMISTNISANTNQGGVMGATITANWTNMIAGGLLEFEDGTGADTELYIPLSAAYEATGLAKVKVKPSLVTDNSFVTLAQNLCKWFIVAMTLYAMFRWGEGAIHKLFEQRQVEGNKQSIAGFNAPWATSYVYAVIICTLIAGAPLILLAFMSGTKAELSALAGAPGAVVGTVYWAYANAVVPVGVMLTAFVTYCTYRFLIGAPMLIIARCIILFCTT